MSFSDLHLAPTDQHQGLSQNLLSAVGAAGAVPRVANALHRFSDCCLCKRQIRKGELPTLAKWVIER